MKSIKKVDKERFFGVSRFSSSTLLPSTLLRDSERNRTVTALSVSKGGTRYTQNSFRMVRLKVNIPIIPFPRVFMTLTQKY
jgi:hypothetical protein